MGAWGFSLTENDSALDYIADMEDILGFSDELYILKNSNQNLSSTIIEKIKNKFLEKREKLLMATSEIPDDVLVFGLFLVQLNIRPTEEEILFIENALKHELEYINDWDEPDERKNILENFKNSFEGLYHD